MTADRTDPPRSGVPGITPRQVRDRMLALGWPVIPITAPEMRNGGKRPGPERWQSFAVYEDAPRPPEGQLLHWDMRASDWPGTGIPCGEVIAIDIDVSCDVVLAEKIERIVVDLCGSTPFVRVGSAPKRALIYRAGEAIAPRHLKALHLVGNGIDIQGEGTHLVAFGIHPTTARPYKWPGDETPLTAGPQAAPSITNVQIDTALDRIATLLPLGATHGRKGGGKGGSSTIVRDPLSGLVTDGRETHCFLTVWRSANEMHDAGLDVDVEALTDRAFARFEATTDLTAQDHSRGRPDVKMKAVDLVRKLREKSLTLGPKIVLVEPTYPDERKSIDDAGALCVEAVAAVFRRAQDFKYRKVAFDDGEPGARGLPPIPFACALNVETGVGKSEAVLRATETALREAATLAVRHGMTINVGIPRTALGDELARRFEDDVDFLVYRGRSKPDPDTPNTIMCQNLDAAKAAFRAGARSVYEAVCDGKDGSGKRRRCPRFGSCGYMRQRTAKPAVCLFPSNLLFNKRPAVIPAADLLVIDESFEDGAFGEPVKLSLGEIARAPLPLARDQRTPLADWRNRLADAICASAPGFFATSALIEAGIDAPMAKAAGDRERVLWVDPEIVPGLGTKEVERLAKRVSESNRQTAAREAIALEIADALDLGNAYCGRLRVTIDGAGTRGIELRPFTPVDLSWRAPTLMINATSPSAKVLTAVLGLPVEMLPPISAVWSKTVRVKQFVGAPVSAKKLGIVKGQEHHGGPEIYRDLRRHIEDRARRVFPREVAVVGQEKAIAKLKMLGLLPSSVVTGYFGALTGRDDMKKFAGMILFGQPTPKAIDVEDRAARLTGSPPTTILGLGPDGRPLPFPYFSGGIRLADGSGVETAYGRHPDPLADHFLWLVREAGLIQAIGRMRPHRRTPENACFVDIISDVALPIVVDAVVPWHDAKAGAQAEMAAAGIILTSPGDIEIVFPMLAATRDVARNLAGAPTAGQTPILDSYIGDSPAVGSVLKITYKRKGREHRPTVAYALPNGLQTKRELRRFVLPALGEMDYFEVEGELTPTWADRLDAACARPLARHVADARDRQASLLRLIDANCDPGAPEAANDDKAPLEAACGRSRKDRGDKAAEPKNAFYGIPCGVGAPPVRGRHTRPAHGGLIGGFNGRPAMPARRFAGSSLGL